MDRWARSCSHLKCQVSAGTSFCACNLHSASLELVVTGRNVIASPELGLEIVSALHKLYPSQFQLQKIATLLVNRKVLDALLAGRDPQRILEDWQPQLQDFEARRKPYLLY
jgi:hypothetical protein